jgi:hypothetical protein
MRPAPDRVDAPETPGRRLPDAERNARLDELVARTQPLRSRLQDHEMYGNLRDLAAVRVFMATHVLAVWDFMSLLKSLQLRLTGVRVPWIPIGDATVRRFINELVIEEESDEHPTGGHASHFELYLDAMRQAGCDCRPIDAVCRAVAGGGDAIAALRDAEVPRHVVDFVKLDLDLATAGQTHEIAAVFTLGREHVIPGMFAKLTSAAAIEPERLSLFEAYLTRHIGLDGDVHAPMAFRMLSILCGDDARRWEEAEAAARRALEARVALWDGVLEQLRA